jgi:hypothetical protein
VSAAELQALPPRVASSLTRALGCVFSLRAALRRRPASGTGDEGEVGEKAADVVACVRELVEAAAAAEDDRTEHGAKDLLMRLDYTRV